MTNTSSHFSIVLKNEEYELARLREAIDEFTKLNEFSEKERFELQLCLEEALKNIVKYGFDDIDEHSIDVQVLFQVDERTLVVRIVDDGNAFNSFRESALQDLDTLLQGQSSGGLGFGLLRKYTGNISYHRQGGFNHLVLTKEISGEAN